jgi:hypothetical protein
MGDAKAKAICIIATLLQCINHRQEEANLYTTVVTKEIPVGEAVSGLGSPSSQKGHETMS